MRGLNEFLNESAYPKSEKGWDKKYKEIKALMKDASDLEKEEFIERMGYDFESAMTMAPNGISDDEILDLMDVAWSKLKGDKKAKQKAIAEYIDGGWV